MAKHFGMCCPKERKIGGVRQTLPIMYHSLVLTVVVSAVGRMNWEKKFWCYSTRRSWRWWLNRPDYPTGTVQVTLDDEGALLRNQRGRGGDNIPLRMSWNVRPLAHTCCLLRPLAQRNEVSRATIARFLDTIFDIDGQLKIFWYQSPPGFLLKSYCVNRSTLQRPCDKRIAAGDYQPCGLSRHWFCG